MQEGKTIGQLMEEMRQKAGAQNYHGHDYIDVYKRQYLIRAIKERSPEAAAAAGLEGASTWT